MKWFKHESDAHTNIKLQALIDKLGIAGYGYYWACVELVANQGGEEFKITKNKHWEQHLKKMLNLEPKEQKKYLIVLATHNLIDLKELKNGNLYIPKLVERCDEYSIKKKNKESVRRVSGQAPDNVVLEEKRRDKKRREEEAEKYLLNIPLKDQEEFYKRFDCSKKQIISKGEELLNYCKMHDKVYKNYKAFLLNALKGDFKERTTPILPPRKPEIKPKNDLIPKNDINPIPPDIKRSMEEIINNIKA